MPKINCKLKENKNKKVCLNRKKSKSNNDSISEKTTLIDKLEGFATRHPIIFWGGSIAWILIPDPIPIIDDIILTVILSLVGLRKLSK